MEYQRTTNANQSKRKGEAHSSVKGVPSAHRAMPPLLQLHHAIGNHGVGQLIQAKLKLSQPDDSYEQEADRVAKNVMQMAQPEVPNLARRSEQIQRKCVCASGAGVCPECTQEEEEFQAKPLSDGPFIQRSTDSASRVESPLSERTTGQWRGSGQPLPATERAFFEPRFGQDFSEVRVHTSADASESACVLNALAYTTGRDVVFAAGRYAPGTPEGRKLLAHELTHTVQQGASRPGRPSLIQRQSPPAPAPPTADGGLSREMLAQIARQLHQAMAGLGTDESAIFAALGGRTQDQVNGIARVYREIYHEELIDELRSELSDSEMRELGGFAPASPAGTVETPADLTRRARVTAQQLYEAMDRLGTDESAIYAALTGRTEPERQAIKDAYRQIGHHHELEADLRDELSGSELVRALRLLNQGMLAPEDELYLAMEGLGTDEDTIFRVLDAMTGDNAKIQNMEASYRTKYRSDLIADLRGDLSGEDYSRALRVLRPALSDTAFEDCDPAIISQIRALVPEGIRKVDHAISVLSKGWAGMNAAEQLEFNTYFDPHGAGFDRNFVGDVLSNFRKIRREFDNELTVECEPDTGGLCSRGNLYYTYWSNVHVCAPSFAAATDLDWKQRSFVHELTHNALLAVDRPYYISNRSKYDAMTPRGNWAAQIPIVGPLFRLISRSDTLNAPDAYAFFAFRVP